MSEHPITAEICAKPKNRDKPGHVRHTRPRPDHRGDLHGVPFQADQHPWQHGISKSTNGLPREYFPKGEPQREAHVEATDGLNRSQYETRRPETLHLI